MSLLSRFTNVFRRPRVERDIEDEQRFHLDARIDELMRAGHTRASAEAHAVRRFGAPLRLREASRDVKLMTGLEGIFQDARLGLRLLRKDAVVTGAAIVSLALAIGGCVAAFMLVDALILRPLPVREPARLVYMSHGDSDDQRLKTLFSYPLYERFRDAAPSQLTIFTMSYQMIRHAVLPDAGGREEKLRVQWISGNAFEVLGVRAAHGRLLTIDDDRQPGGHSVAVISHAFWTRRFGGAAGVLGRWIAIEQKPVQIVGIAQEGFTGTEPGALTDVWVPNMMWSQESLTNPHSNWLRIWARLAPGVEPETTRAHLQSVFASFEREIDTRPRRPDELTLLVESAATGPSALRAAFERPLVILAAVVGLVLLIACSNLANLMVARGAARAREMALRVAIGAGRGRLLQQVSIESGILALLAAALGLLFARLSIPLIVQMLARVDNPVYLDVGVGWRAAAVAIALALVTAALFGLAPALRAARVAPSEVLAASGPRYASRTMLLRSLVASQIAFSLMVLFVAALLLRSFDRLLRVDLGFEPSNVVLVTVEAREKLHGEAARAVRQQLLDRVRQIPGVDAASLSGWALFKGWSWGCGFGISGEALLPSSCLAVSPGFFATMGIRLLDGRELEPRDTTLPTSDDDPSVPRTVVVNEAFARKFFPNGRSVGRQVEWERQGRRTAMEIVGVARDAKDGDVRAAAGPFMFLPTGDADGTLQVRTSRDVSIVAPLLREVIARTHPALRVTDITPQSALVDNTMLRERLLAVLSGFFGLVGLVLAAVGLYGVASYTVVRRTREIGIRLALGARAAVVVRAVLRDLAVVVVLGVAGGLGGGVFFARYLQTLLYETETLSFGSFALPAAALILVALLATLAPGRRAARVSPTEALRYE